MGEGVNVLAQDLRGDLPAIGGKLEQFASQKRRFG